MQIGYIVITYLALNPLQPLQDKLFSPRYLISYFKISAVLLCCPSSKEYVNTQVRTKKIVKRTILITTLVLQDYPQGYILLYFIEHLGLYLSLEYFVESPLKLVFPTISPWLGKFLNFMVFRLLRNILASQKS